MKNKELIQRLVDYFLTQKPETVARGFAGAMLDMCRIRSMSDLPEDELACLLERIDKNAIEIHKFAKNGPSGDLNVHRINRDEEEAK